jgi:SNF2 family DNA or RNA helicase
MQIYGVIVKQTPLFRILCEESDPWNKVWGAVFQGDGWAYPAYWPFGEWVVNDFTALQKHGEATLEWDPTALELLKTLRTAAKGWADAKAAYDKGERVPLPVGDDFFPPGYLPFAHQRLGIARAYYAYRSFFLWEMGTGKTKTIVDTSRILRRENRFKRALVVAPRVVIPTWIREIERCSMGQMRASVWGERKFDPTADFLLMTYGKVRSEANRAEEVKTLIHNGRSYVNRIRERDKKKPYTPEEFEALKLQQTDRIQELDYDTIVVDESHSIGSWDSRQTQAVLALCNTGKASRRVLLTGTAADNPRKLYPQLRFLSPSILDMDYYHYDNRYLVHSTDPKKKFLVVGYKNMNELNEKVGRVATWMKKKDCLDLPELMVVDMPFKMSQEQITQYNNLVAEVLPKIEDLVQKGFSVNSLKKDEDGMWIIPTELSNHFHVPHVAALLNKLLQMISGFLLFSPTVTICDNCEFRNHCVNNHIKPYTKDCKVETTKPPTEVVRNSVNPKLDIFSELLDELMESDETNKVLCWGVYLPELDDMEAVVKKKKLGYVRVDGSTSHHVRKFEDRFREDPKCRVWISQVSAGIGINLASANYAIYYTLPWSLPQYQQSMERNNRPGQKREMTAYRLLTTRALDRNVLRALEHKVVIASTLVDEIDCKKCDDLPRCTQEKNRPFDPGCKYQAAMDRPIAKATVIPQETLVRRSG